MLTTAVLNLCVNQDTFFQNLFLSRTLFVIYLKWENFCNIINVFTDTFDQMNVSLLNKKYWLPRKKNHNAPPNFKSQKCYVEASERVIKYTVRYMCISAAVIQVSCQHSQHFKALYISNVESVPKVHSFGSNTKAAFNGQFMIFVVFLTTY